MRFELTAADVNMLCRESAAAAKASPGPAVRLDLDPTVPPVTVDVERLRIALVNLIVNARDAVEASQVAPTPDLGRQTPSRPGETATRGAGPAAEQEVCVSTRAHNGQVTIAITDTGTGIDTADLSRVFEPYFTTKRGGTGLGLPIAKNIVEGLGGSISVESGPGRGTEIRVELPSSTAGHPRQAS
jgi:signal transduction histidine kinase